MRPFISLIRILIKGPMYRLYVGYIEVVVVIFVVVVIVLMIMKSDTFRGTMGCSIDKGEGREKGGEGK